MNTYHPELLYEEMLNGKEKSYEELKEYFKDLWKSNWKVSVKNEWKGNS